MSDTRLHSVAGVLVVALAIACIGCRRPVATAPPAVPEVVVAPVVQRDVPLYSEWVGTTQGFVNARIHPKISGYLLNQNYEEGDLVQKGQLLFQIDARQYKAALDQALGDLAEKQAESKKNQQDLARYRPLIAAQVISREQFDHIAQAAHASGAAVEAAQAVVESARLNLQWTQVTSPIGGIAGIAKAQVGDLVGTTTLLTTVSQLNPIKVTFPISEREYLHFAERIRKHEENGVTKSEPSLQMILADGSTYKYSGHFYIADRQVNAQTGTILIEGLFPNPDDILRPGLYAKIRVAADFQRGALLVPQSAVLATQGQYQVAVVTADNRVSLRMVITGKEFGRLRIIKQGLEPGDRVIVEGLQKVKDGMEVSARPIPVAPTAAPVAARQLESSAVTAKSLSRP